MPQELLKILGFDLNVGDLPASALSDLLAESIAPPMLSIVAASIAHALFARNRGSAFTLKMLRKSPSF